MNIIYNIAIALYSAAIRITAHFNTKAKQFVHGRRQWEKQLRRVIDPANRYLWIHCASLGEFEQGRPLIEKIKKEQPQYRILLTFFSPSGYEVRKNYPLADIVAYLPIDNRRNARKFIGLIKPEMAFFIKYEFWYHYINELKHRQIPLYIVSAIFREGQLFFKKGFPGHWFRQMLLKTEHLFVQNTRSAELLQSAGITHCTVAGDTRFDRVAEIARNTKEIPMVDKFKDGSPLLVAGSTWKPDEELLTPFINNHPDLKVIIAPHEVTEENMNRLEKLLINRPIRFSQCTGADLAQVQVLIIDSIGLLSSLYRYGDVAYIGGGFGVGIHNILEAATFGLPIIFGPNHQKFKEAVDLKNEGGAFPVNNPGELDSILGRLIQNPGERHIPSEICKHYVKNHVGATEIIIKKVFNK